MNWFVALAQHLRLGASRASRELVQLKADYEELAKAHVRAQTQLSECQKREAYWQTRAERLIDNALTRAQATSEPVMREREKSDLERGMTSVVAHMGRTEFRPRSTT